MTTASKRIYLHVNEEINIQGVFLILDSLTSSKTVQILEKRRTFLFQRGNRMKGV